jgi:hypothetical protein
MHEHSNISHQLVVNDCPSFQTFAPLNFIFKKNWVYVSISIPKLDSILNPILNVVPKINSNFNLDFIDWN